MAYQSKIIIFTTAGVSKKVNGTITSFINQPFQFEAKRKAYITCLSVEMMNHTAIPSTFTMNQAQYNIQFILPTLIESTLSGNGSSDFLFFVINSDTLQLNMQRKISSTITPALYGTTIYNFNGSLFPYTSTTKKILPSTNDYWGFQVLDGTGLTDHILLTYFSFSLVCRIDNYF